MTTKTNLITPTYNSIDWNVPLNANFGAVNEAIGGTEAVSISGGNVTLSATQARKMRISVSGTLTADRYVFFPAGCSGFWIISNFTTGDYYLKVKNVSGTKEVVLVQGVTALVCSDGVDTLVADEYGSSPVGSIMIFAGDWTPPGYLLCDGAQVSRVDYARLYYSIGTLWGSGNGVSTFNIPDLRGYFLRGWGVNSDGTEAGGPVGYMQPDALGSHTHTAYQNAHNHTVALSSNSSVSGAPGGNMVAANPSTTTSSAQPPVYVNATGTFETRPKNATVFYCIKY